LYYLSDSRVDFVAASGDNQLMEAIPSEILADMRRATELAMSGQKDPAFERRVQAEAKKVRDQIFQKHGALDIGVAAIRELRDE
jgi:hypothetical protein